MAMCCQSVREKGQGIGGGVLRSIGVHRAIMDRGNPKGRQVMAHQTSKIKAEMMIFIYNSVTAGAAVWECLLM